MIGSVGNRFRFAEFAIDPAKRLLLKNDVPIALNSKTFDLLEALIERRGEVLTKDELLEKIWEGQFVEESNLTVQISTLRKLLGEARGENKFIATVPGKGYKFVGEPVAGIDETSVEQDPAPHLAINAEIELDAPPKLTAASSKRRLYFAGVSILLLAAVFGSGYFLIKQFGKRSGSPFLRNQIRRLTNNGRVQIAALSPDGKVFAYVVDEHGRKSLNVGHVDGGNDVVLLPSAESTYGALAFSPDGNSLFFTIRNETTADGALFRISSFGGVPEKIRNNIDNFALSPDGKVIAFCRRNENDKTDHLFLNDLSGPENELLSMPATRWLDSHSISFSPDGRLIAFGASDNPVAIRQELYTARIADGEVRQITHQAFGYIDHTSWLPGGDQLLIEASDNTERSGVPRFKVWHINVSDGAAEPVTNDLSSYADSIGLSKDILLSVEHRQVNNVWIAPAEDLKQAKQITFGSFGKYEGLWGLDWTPDGRIVFDSSDPQSQVISIMNSDGSNKKQLTAPGNVDSCLSVSNDGRFVVFHSTRGGQGTDIWRLEISNGDLRRLTTGNQNYHPAISSDSRFVYYKSWEKGVGELHRIPIDGGESEQLNDKETSWMTASPDGKYLAASYKTDKARLGIFSVDGGTPMAQFDAPKTALFYVGIRWMPDSKTVVYRDSDYGYWQQSIKGGPPTRMENLPKEYLYNFAWSKDGRQLAFVRGEDISDVVLLRDLP